RPRHPSVERMPAKPRPLRQAARHVRTAEVSMSVPHHPVAEAPRTQEVKKQSNPIKRFFKILGPGLITGASDDDPSGIATYTQAGAQFGYGPLWLALFTFPLMATVQYICAKIGLVSGKGLTGV